MYMHINIHISQVHEWMQKMVNLSWRKHELLPVPASDA